MPQKIKLSPSSVPDWYVDVRGNKWESITLDWEDDGTATCDICGATHVTDLFQSMRGADVCHNCVEIITTHGRKQ